MTLSKFSCFEEYKKWVIRHSDILGQVETFGRISSYLIAGRIKKSPAFSEFLYSATNIIVFMNDQILLNASQSQRAVISPPILLERSRVFLTTLEYLQVFMEITALKMGGYRGKWTIITIIQTIKFLWRVFVLIQHRSGLALFRPIPPLNRKKLLQITTQNLNFVVDAGNDPSNSYAFCLKSGRVIRKVNGAPQINKRNWKPPMIQEVNTSNTNTQLEGFPLIGEVMYTAKPLCHLAAMHKCGTSSWLPWLIALGMDLTSLKLLESSSPLNAEEKKEIQRRQLTLLLYLIRSPFYQRFSHKVLTTALTKLGRLPLLGFLPQYLLQYLPYWQQLYSYTWD